ncbi:MAG: type 1 glutamine amidotransferase domain-containing protein [Calditrichae bacterium]|nr:type 1 glutamine amidotransferase domain-containing protein [Calditrichia bacterium]
MKNKKAKILIYLSSASAVPCREGGTHSTGVFLGELTEPLQPLLESGHLLHFASPDGKPPVIDKNSYKLMYWGFSKKHLETAKNVFQELNDLGMNKPQKINELSDKDLDSFDVLFIPGGHAPMTDILYKNWLESQDLNLETGKILLHFHQKQKPTSLICHAPAVLATAPEINNQWIYKDYKMTCVTMVSEWLTEDAPGFKVMDGHLPDYPQKILKRKGANLQLVNIPMLSKVVEDRELITGQDPYSAAELGRKLLIKIEKYLETK